MEITLKNFGPIREFQINLDKDFHLFVGKNNIGKSYAITAIYLIVKSMIGDRRSFNPYWDFSDFFLHDDDFVENIIKTSNVSRIVEILNETNHSESINIQEYVEEDTRKLFEKTFVSKITNSFENTFLSIENLDNCFSTGALEILLNNDFFSSKLCVSDKKFCVSEFKLKSIFTAKKIKQHRSPYERKGAVTLYHCGTDKSSKTLATQYFNYCVYRSSSKMFREITEEIAGVHYLPASRSGLYQALSAFGQIIAELSKNRSFLSKKIELPGISEPVSDYFIKLSDIRVSKKSFENKAINKIARNIEEKILKGKIEFNSQTKQLMFYPDDTDLKLELSSTSSMVSELAPIVSYLRYVLTKEASPSRLGKKAKKSLIMIEEPEAHLHPEIQIVLTEIFAMLANSGVKLIITSHSNYIFNKVNNLILSGDLSINNVSSSVFKKTTTGSISRPLDINDLGIEDNNFTDATDFLLQEKIDLIDKINEGIGAGRNKKND